MSCLIEKLQLYRKDYSIVNEQKLFLEGFKWLVFQFKSRKRNQATLAIDKFKKRNS